MKVNHTLKSVEFKLVCCNRNKKSKFLREQVLYNDLFLQYKGPEKADSI